MIRIIFFCGVLVSCINKPVVNSSSCVKINDGVLTIDINRLGKEGLNKINLVNNSNSNQTLLLNDKLNVSKIYNIVNCPISPEFINTWTTFDKQNNFNFSESYYYSSFLTRNDSIVFINCFLKTLVLEGKYYVLNGEYDENFNLTSSNQDTIFFNDEVIASIPVKKWTKGANNKRFIIVEEESSKDTIQYKRTFVNKDFYLN